MDNLILYNDFLGISGWKWCLEPRTERQTAGPRNGAVPTAAEKDRHPTRRNTLTRRAKAMAVDGGRGSRRPASEEKCIDLYMRPLFFLGC